MTGATGPRWPSAILLVAAGGALGGPARYGVERLAAGPSGVVPWGTLAVNLTGAFVLGVLVSAVHSVGPATGRLGGPGVSLLLGTGFLGAFTTFSAYLVQVLALAGSDQVLLAVGYLLGSIVLGAVAAWVGYRCGPGGSPRSSG